MTTLPNFGETPDELAGSRRALWRRHRCLWSGTGLTRGSAERADDTRYFFSLYQFASEQDAAGWLKGGAERALQFPNVIAAIPVAGAGPSETHQ